MSTDTKAVAHRAGTLYFIMALLMIVGYMYLPTKYMVLGDAAATAQRITANPFVFRLSILNALVAQLLFVAVIVTLYQLFRDVNRQVARLMAALVCVGIAAELVTIGTKMAPLTILNGASYWSSFTRPQLESLAYGFLRLNNNLGTLITIIWGLWLFPFGLLTIRSGFFPKVLGYLLMIAGTGYVISCVTFIMWPEQLSAVTRMVTPLYFGEFPIILWMMIRGAALRPARADRDVLQGVEAHG